MTEDIDSEKGESLLSGASSEFDLSIEDTDDSGLDFALVDKVNDETQKVTLTLDPDIEDLIEQPLSTELDDGSESVGDANEDFLGTPEISFDSDSLTSSSFDISNEIDFSNDSTNDVATDYEPLSADEYDEIPMVEVGESAVPETESVVETSEEFEIPLLDDAAVNMQFEEEFDVVENNSTGNEPLEKSSLPRQNVWVLGASLGGPAAIKRFFQALPEDVPTAFILGQHIDESFLHVLANILDSQTNINAKVIETNTKIENGWVYIAPIHSRLSFNEANQVFLTNEPWTPPYAPCIDDLIAATAKAFGENTGVIIFSGMGEDGRIGVEAAKQHQATVWAQSPETSANGSMPEAIINNNMSEYVASPEQLASQLSHLLQSR